ncbi:hypothetical protein EOA30_07015 [Mesorhizobium sp. M8A.F.Ca.ET.059.01.1.1]|nr:hypothetical protein EOA30_07015 [Mesorhizobium sp. M8A.F.Ca.ET.059.01.1.1]
MAGRRELIPTVQSVGSRPRLLRLWNDDVIRDIDNVCQHILIEAGLADAEMPASEPATEELVP